MILKTSPGEEMRETCAEKNLQGSFEFTYTVLPVPKLDHRHCRCLTSLHPKTPHLQGHATLGPSPRHPLPHQRHDGWRRSSSSDQRHADSRRRSSPDQQTRPAWRCSPAAGGAARFGSRRRLGSDAQGILSLHKLWLFYGRIERAFVVLLDFVSQTHNTFPM
jgi:hypothetical protein